MAPRNLLRKEFLRYFGISIFCFGIDFSLLFLMTHHLSFHYLVSAFLAIFVGNILNYNLSIRFVFSHRKLQERSRELTIFLCVGLGAIPFHHLILWICTESFSIHYLQSKVIAAGASFILIFGLRKYILF
jgi:putative flippase GtrA